MTGTPMLDSYYIQNNDNTEIQSFVKLARRKRSNSRRNSLILKSKLNTKTQGRPLLKQTKVRFTLVQNLTSLYNELVPTPLRRSIEILKVALGQLDDTLKELNDLDKVKLNIKPLLFMEEESIYDQDHFETIDDAIKSLFQIEEYTLLRITRAAATEPGGTLLLKIESAMPGDIHLNDDEYDDNEFNVNDLSLGSIGDRPTTTFLKKKVARPRYKSNMRIYLLPRITNVVMYLEERMLRRDLLKGVLDLTKDSRSVLCSFDPNPVLSDLDNLTNSIISSPDDPLFQQSHSPMTSLCSTGSIPQDDFFPPITPNFIDQRILPPIPQDSLQDPILQYYSLLQQLPTPPIGQQQVMWNNSNNFYHTNQLQQQQIQDLYNINGVFNNYNYGNSI